MTNLISADPYFDDFDETKGFHQILFKPGYAVQARELTQLQTIIRDQIGKFGKSIYKQGSVVIPGNATSELNVSLIKVTGLNGTSAINTSLFKDVTIVGTTSGLEAYVKHIEPSTSTDPLTFYIGYTKGSGASGAATFEDGEEIYIKGSSSIKTRLIATNANGNGSLVHLNKGVFFVNSSFVYVNDQTVVASKYTTNPSCHVMLKIVTTIVDADMDETLLDPANGAYNYSAPGADRLRIELVLTTLPYDPLSPTIINDDYIELMRFNDGVLELNNRYAQYSELEKSLARRTFDESGNYKVSGFVATLRESLRTNYNNGLSATGDRDKFCVEMTAGKAYIDGFEVERISPSRLILDKGRTDDHVKTKAVAIQNNFGKYVYVSDISQTLPDFHSNEIVNLYDQSSGGGIIGSMRVTSLDFWTGDTVTGIFKLFYHSLTLDAGKTLNDVGRFVGSVTGTASGFVLQRLTVPNATKDFSDSTHEIVGTASNARIAKVKYYSRTDGNLYVYKHSSTSTPLVSEIITGATSTAVATITDIERSVVVGALPVFPLPVHSVKATKTATNTYDASYTVIKSFTIATDSSGFGSYTASGGTFLAPEVGNTTITTTGGIGNVNLTSVTSAGTTFNITGGTHSSTYYVTTQFQKSGAAPRTKTLVPTFTITAASPTSSSLTISLTKADIYQIKSITDASGVDWTNYFTLFNGQTDQYYGVGAITFRGSVFPTGTLTITFSYFNHNSGDYFSADSYSTLGTDYLELIPTYNSVTTNISYNLRECLDFRPRIGESDSFVDLIVPGSTTFTSVQYYVARSDTIFIDSNGMIDAIRGTPSDTPKIPSAPTGTLKLYDVYVPAYTDSLADVVLTKDKNQRYTMKDISNLEDRIANVEYFSQLNAIENSLLTYEVTDAKTGLNRFKTGYLVDNFSNPFTVCDFSNPLMNSQFRALQLSPATEYHDTQILIDEATSSNYMVTGGQVTLPYTEVPFISQLTSTRVTNVNHFMIIGWSGQMELIPAVDKWIERVDLPEINNTVTVIREEHVTIYDPVTVEPVQWPAPEPYVPPAAQGPSTVAIAVNNSLGVPGATGATVFNVPASAVHQVPGGYALNPDISGQQAIDWAINQVNSGATTQYNGQWGVSGLSTFG